MDISCEPMDIDLSLNSIKNMDISYCEAEEPMGSRSVSPFDAEKFLLKDIKQEYVTENVDPVIESIDILNGFQNVKKYHIIMQNKKQSSNFMKLSIVIVLIVSVIVYHVNSFSCSEELDIRLLKETLGLKLFGQHRAIELLSTMLDTKVSSKILFLFGGTGVGKTYATSLMLEKVWNSSNVFHYTMPTFLERFPNDLLLGMTVCKSSILIVDDLTQHDMNIRDHIENVIEKSENLKKNITVILIFNLDNIELDFSKSSDAAFFEFELRDYFNKVEAYKEYIKFEPLTEDHLKMCIQSELGYSNVANLNQIMKNFNVTLDGCKGVYTKIKLLNLL